MLFNGRRYGLCKNVVVLPTRNERGLLHPFVNCDMENYVYFGRTFPDQIIREGMVKTAYRLGDEVDSPHVYAMPLRIKYFTFENHALCDDNYFYLAIDSRVYRAKKNGVLIVR